MRHETVGCPLFRARHRATAREQLRGRPRGVCGHVDPCVLEPGTSGLDM